MTCTALCIVYKLVIREAIDGSSSETILTIVCLFYKNKTTDFRLLWDKAQSEYKDHDMAVTWNIRKSVELPGLCQIKHAFS